MYHFLGIKSDINNDLDWHKLRYVVCQRQIIFDFFGFVMLLCVVGSSVCVCVRVNSNGTRTTMTTQTNGQTKKKYIQLNKYKYFKPDGEKQYARTHSQSTNSIQRSIITIYVYHALFEMKTKRNETTRKNSIRLNTISLIISMLHSTNGMDMFFFLEMRLYSVFSTFIIKIVFAMISAKHFESM